MIERFIIPPDAKARLAMRERRDTSHEANAHRSNRQAERCGELPHLADEREGEAAPADLS